MPILKPARPTMLAVTLSFFLSLSLSLFLSLPLSLMLFHCSSGGCGLRRWQADKWHEKHSCQHAQLLQVLLRSKRTCWKKKTQLTRYRRLTATGWAKSRDVYAPTAKQMPTLVRCRVIWTNKFWNTLILIFKSYQKFRLMVIVPLLRRMPRTKQKLATTLPLLLVPPLGDKIITKHHTLSTLKMLWKQYV